MVNPMLNRRQFGLLTAGLMAPKRLLAGPRKAGSGSRKFLFLFNDGGWDTSFVFTPMWDVANAYTEPGSAPATVGGMSFVDHPDRPSVRQFFENWGHKAAVINGLEVQSVTHERCRELVLTGSGALADDWASVLAGRSSSELLLPHVVIDGPAFTNQYTSGVVRVGDAGQLPRLLDGTALDQSTHPITALPAGAESLADAFVAQRASGLSNDFGDEYRKALDRIDDLRSSDDLDLSNDEFGCERDIVADCGAAFDLFSSGLSRCAMLRYKGWCSEGWDTHQNLDRQSQNFGDLFGYINEALADLSTRTSLSGSPLADEVTIVVFSEMGREPQLNPWAGRDHWTFTSCLLIGSGIQGGRTVGALDGFGQGQPVDLASGDVHSTGTALLPEHLGATLLALGDVDPGEMVGDVEPIGSVMA